MVNKDFHFIIIIVIIGINQINQSINQSLNQYRVCLTRKLKTDT